MSVTSSTSQSRRLDIVLTAFFALAFASACVVYIVVPSMYTQSLALTTSPGDSHPLAATLFLVALAIFIALLIVGVLRHWRWLFWLILLAFAASVIDIPVTLLQFASVLPQEFPVWYSLFRMGVSIIEIAIAVWMIQIARSQGVWGLGKSKAKAA